MRLDGATLETVLAVFENLQRKGFRRPEIPKDQRELAEAYLEELHDLPAKAVEAGVTTFIREDARGWWPKIADIRKAALAARRGLAQDTQTDATARYWAWEHGGRRTEDKREMAPCPVCDAVIAPTWNGRLILTHDHQRHVEAGVLPYVRG
jgi:hypothetical protein